MTKSERAVLFRRAAQNLNEARRDARRLAALLEQAKAGDELELEVYEAVRDIQSKMSAADEVAAIIDALEHGA